jgi:hypothetical protein
MTQPLPISVVEPVQPTIVQPKIAQPKMVQPALRAVQAVVPAPAAKPSPIPVRAAAPEAVYEPDHNERPKTVIRKNEPISVAHIKPTQWVPGRYESPAEPPAAPVTTAAIEKKAAPAPSPAVEQITPPPPRRQATLRTGMSIAIRLDEFLSSGFSPAGGTFQGSLIEPLIADGFVIAERGARVTGRIIDSQKAGRFTGTSRLQLGLTNLTTTDGQRVSISTDPWMKLGDNIPSETAIRFRLASTVTITEQQIAGK